MVSSTLEQARVAAEAKKYDAAEAAYQQILRLSAADLSPAAVDKLLAEQEVSALELGNVFREQGNATAIVQLIEQLRNLLGALAKLKMAKILRQLIDLLTRIPNALEIQVQATEELIAWAVEQKLLFLRQALQLKLAQLQFSQKKYADLLAILLELLREYKKLDDKLLLVEVQLLESKNYHALRSLAKARAALTSARTSANAVYTPTLTQAELDTMSGILNAEDKDYKTAFSYFYEAFDGFNTLDDPRTVEVLKYMLLLKIMLNLIDDVNGLLANKNVMKHTLRDVDAMKAIATAYSNRLLKEFEDAMHHYANELKSDDIIRLHFTDLYDTLLEQNLLKVIEPFLTVEVEHIASVIGLDVRQVEGKLLQMILDKVFYGVLDQGNGWLVIYDQPRNDAAYEASLEVVKHMSQALDLLYERALVLH